MNFRLISSDLRTGSHKLVTTFVRPEPVEGPSTPLGLNGLGTFFRGAVLRGNTLKGWTLSSCAES